MEKTIYHLVMAPTGKCTGIKIADDLAIEKISPFYKQYNVKPVGEEKNIMVLISDIVTEDSNHLIIKTDAGIYKFIKNTAWKSQLRESNKDNVTLGNVTLKCHLYWYEGSVRKISALINDIMDYVEKEFRYRISAVSFDMDGYVMIDGSNDPLL